MFRQMEKRKKKSEWVKILYEPMLNLEVRLYYGDDGRDGYNELLGDVSDRELLWNETWNTIIEPLEKDKWVFRAMRVYDKEDYRYLIHEMYHLTTAIIWTYWLDEEWWAYLIWWLAKELI